MELGAPHRRWIAVAASIIAAGLVATLTAAPTDAHARIFVAANGCTGHTWRPHRIIIACGDGNFYASHLAYSRYGGATARASGLLYVNNCQPACFDGTFRSYRGSVILSNIASCQGRLYYMRIAYRFRGRTPYKNGSEPLRPFACS